MSVISPEPSNDLVLEPLVFELIDEFRITPEQKRQILMLLQVCFMEPGAIASRIYYKQVPPRRLLVWKDQALVGHMGVEYRVLGTNDGPVSIFGVIDLCVSPEYRNQGIASQMLTWLDKLGRETEVDFIILFALKPDLYRRNGFYAPMNPLRWVKIHEHQIIGIGEEVLSELMVKGLKASPWPGGIIDLLGYQF